jgi:NAD(P)-dependent dehydrogenase (short-subunit alcohol dehydrogenase family)
MSAQSAIALVTGGSRGIGRATVEALAQRGIDTIFTYKNNRDAADQVIAVAEQAGARALALQLDTSDTPGFTAFADLLRHTLGQWEADRIDFLVNNAGTSYSALFPEVTEEEFDKLYRVHFKGVFFLTQTLLPLIADGGRIVNVTSSVTRIISPGSMSYALMKSAVEMWTVYLAKELSARRIAVNAVAPGSTMTDFSDGVVRDDPEVNRKMAEATALGRAGRPEDIGQTIASLLSPENAWITAQRIEASGGLML